MDLRLKNEWFLRRRSIFQIHFCPYGRILGANLTARDVLIPNLACGYHQEMIFSALESQTNAFYKLRHKIKWGRISRTQNWAYYMTKGQNFTPIGTTDAINSTISISHGAGKPPPFPPPFLKHNFASQGSPIDTQMLFYGIFRVLHNIPHIYDSFSRFPPPFPPPIFAIFKKFRKNAKFFLIIIFWENALFSRSRPIS